MKHSNTFFLLITLISILLLINNGAYAQDSAESVDQRLQVVRNDGGVDGEFHVAVQVKATEPPGEPLNTLFTATIDVTFDNNILQYIGFNPDDWAFDISDGYFNNIFEITVDDTTFARIDINGEGVDGSDQFPGFQVEDEYVSWIIIRFSIIDQNIPAELGIRGNTNSITFFDPDTGDWAVQPLSQPIFIENISLIPHLLTLEASPSEDDGVLEGGGTFGEAHLQTVSAIPNTGREFVNWTHDGIEVSADSTFEYTMPANDVTLVANFSSIEYLVIVNIDPVDGGVVSGDGPYFYEESVVLTATPNTGYEFVNWTENGNVVHEDSVYSFPMPDSDVNLTANFQLSEFELIVLANPENAGDVEGGGFYNHQDIIDISAVPGMGYVFIDWRDAVTNELISSEPTFQYTMPADDVTLIANFEPIIADIIVLLQGPYNTEIAAMNTSLNAGGHLPLNQPYSQEPWEYTGDESVDANFFNENSNIVDWVLIELRTGETGDTGVERRAAFLTNNGTIVDLDGESTIRFFEISEGEYFIVIRHRNHLAVMSSEAVLLNNNSQVYDFSIGQEMAYGSNAMTELDTGVYGLVGGDGNADGFIQSLDFNIYFTDTRAAEEGYLMSDYDMDGQVTGSDFGIYLPHNQSARQSNVPD